MPPLGSIGQMPQIGLTAQRDKAATLGFLKKYLENRFPGKTAVSEEALELMAEFAADIHQLQQEVIALKNKKTILRPAYPKGEGL